jgi:Fur family transcriptional regulator, ferric uptake regulator
MNRINRKSKQRQVILEELQKVVSHPTAMELYELVRRRLPKISLGTVYRNLELLSRFGKIQKLGVGGGEARFDGNPMPHDHIRCVKCGRVGDISGPPLEVLPGVKNDFSGFRVLGHRVEFSGLCPECESKQASLSRNATSLRET